MEKRKILMEEEMALAGQIAIVTGASRGIGRGIALQLGEAGATVYITGRKPSESLNSNVGLSGLEETANEITKRGGKGIAKFVDHGNMAEVRQFFETIENENDGQLDILVNNAYQAVDAIFSNIGKPFYETDPEIWDIVNNVGLRNHYYCSVYASRLMVSRRKGLIINVSSVGGLSYLFNVPYGVGKEALDRLSVDMAEELSKHNVTVTSLWPGAVRTELIGKFYQTEDGQLNDEMEKADVFARGESVEYAGRAVVHFAADPNRIKKSGRIVLTQDLGDEYGFVDVDGVKPPNLRSAGFILGQIGWCRAQKWLPSWLKLPSWLIWLGINRIN